MPAEQRPTGCVFAMAGGGTGGHIIPALAVAQELRRRGHAPFFIGTTTGMEARLVPPAGFDFEPIRIGGLNRVGLLQRLRTFLLLPVSIVRVVGILRRRGARAVFSMGGYVAGPVVLGALLLRLPIVLMEPNAIPGLTNRWMARFAARALVNFDESARYFPSGIAQITGVPVRREFFEAALPREKGVFTVLVTGGSQGSRTLNNASRDSWARLARMPASARVIHQAGRGNAAALEPAFRESGLAGEVVEFISDMPAAFAAADLVVCRAGASTVSELAAAGKASILVPFPFAADNHQQKNAEAMANAGAARLVLDTDMNGERFYSEVAGLLNDLPQLRLMEENARKLARPGAAEAAAKVLEEFA